MDSINLGRDGTQGSASFSGQSQFEEPLPTTNTNTSLPQDQVLPQLCTFDGNQNEYECWRLEATNKILIDGEAIGTPLAQLIYIFSYLKGTAKADCVKLVIQLRSSPRPEVAKLFEHLDKIYKRQNSFSYNLALLQTPQGNTPFQEFFPVFLGHLAQIGGLSWHDTAKISMLLNVMNPNLRTLVSLMAIDDLNFDQYCKLVMRCSMNEEALKVVTGNLGPAAPMPPDVVPMDWTQSYSAHASRPSCDSSGKKFLTDQELKGKRAKWVSTEEIMARKAAKVCLRCARPGCRSSRCPLSAAINPARRTAARANTGQVNPQ
ncbi:Retrotrans-gag domain containing protein [Ceratocystis lukuohia]|uniref:Retrotrans-gag domain containing protein n=1 Tax=Ceratocystis lukuohia TaxID=2019550 RepID=A0ABR4M9W8_9PEZI